jgi:hypothetical protein
MKKKVELRRLRLRRGFSPADSSTPATSAKCQGKDEGRRRRRRRSVRIVLDSLFDLICNFEYLYINCEFLVQDVAGGACRADKRTWRDQEAIRRAS